jgi:hypothetical protein
MSPNISTIVFKLYIPIKCKFKPLKDENSIPEPPNAFDNNEIYSEWSGIHSENDPEWPPLSSSSPIKSPVSHVWPKSPSLSFMIDDHKIMNQEKYAFITAS